MTKPTTTRRLPQQVRGEQRIAAILQAAAQVFYEVGFDAATTDMIAQRAHTAIGSLYDFFPNIAELKTMIRAYLQAVSGSESEM